MGQSPTNDIYRRRLLLQDTLEEVLDGVDVYFQPPPNIHINYPAIVYDYSDSNDVFANNRLYREVPGYTITIIDRDPDSDLPSRLRKKLPLCRFESNFENESLHHTVYKLFY